jgi:tetratricopeptide (TPR) repeat protein
MKKNSLLHFFKAAFLLASCSFVACNLFNPTSSGDVPNNKEALVSEAFSAYRDAKYEDALENFDKALKKDSTLSEAYLGAVKAIMGKHNINVFTMIGEVRLAQKDQIPFMNLSGQELENYQTMIAKSLPYIRELIKRDTLTPPKNNKYLYSDKKITFSQIAAGYSIFEMAESLLKFRKTAVQFNLNISKNSETGKLSIDLEELYNSSLENPENLDLVNTSIAELQNDIQNFTQNILPSIEEFTDLSIFTGESSSESVTKEIEATTSEIQAQISFFLINDNMDNDGDGCIDEEIFDKKDNDGDGLVDEDLRLTLLDRLSLDSDSEEYYVITAITPDGKDHDMDKTVDGEPELTFAVKAEDRIESKNFLLQFANEKSFSNSDSLELKHNVASDTLKASIQYDLKWRKKNIGGCWVNYDEDMFDSWFNGRNEK